MNDDMAGRDGKAVEGTDNAQGNVTPIRQEEQQQQSRRETVSPGADYDSWYHAAAVREAAK